LLRDGASGASLSSEIQLSDPFPFINDTLK
jgi:hypothetical protein